MVKICFKALCGVAAIGILAGSGAAFAQTVPSQTEPGRLIQEPGIERVEPMMQAVPITIEEKEISGEGVSEEKIFVLNRVVLDEGTIYGDETIQAIVSPYVGQMVSFADLQTIARQITVKYRQDGYVFSRAVLTPQEIKDGVVHMRAVEGRITNVDIVGEFEDQGGLIKAFAEKIKSEGPANTADMERYLLLIDDLPGIRARGILRPSDVPGGGNLIVSVEQTLAEGAISVNNRGSDYLGRYQLSAVGVANSAIISHDRTTVRGIMTGEPQEMQFFDIMHERQIGTEGLRLQGRIAYTDTKPGGPLQGQKIEGSSHLFTLDALFPLIRSRRFNVNLIGGFTSIHSETDVAKTDLSKDRLRYFRLGSRVDFTDKWAGVNQFDVEVAHGVDLFNATEGTDYPGPSRANGDQEFMRANLTATRIQEMSNRFSALLSATGQYAWDPLLASEEFAIGGANFGRAYDVGEIVGDHGLAGQLELRYGDLVDHAMLRSYQFYGFYDIGKVWNKDTVFGEVQNASLASAGLGVRFNLAGNVSGYFEVAQPLTRDIASEGGNGDNPRFFFNFVKRF